jgi:hypothetical protein
MVPTAPANRHGLSLFVWIDFLVFATCQSTTPSNFEVYVSTSKSFPDEGSIQSFADDDTFVPPPPYNSNEVYANPQSGQTPSGLEILVAIFFVVAAAWLLIAVFYALLALIVLRLRSRGLLNLNDEEFGRLYLFGTRFYFPCGCILRRYVVAFGHDQQGRPHEDTRGITRSERRQAVEKILFGRVPRKMKEGTLQIDEEMGRTSLGSQTSDSSSDAMNTSEVQDGQNIPSDQSHSQSSEGPVCSICLTEYGK